MFPEGLRKRLVISSTVYKTDLMNYIKKFRPSRSQNEQYNSTLLILFICYTTYSHLFTAAKSLQSCPTLCDPIDGSPAGSPVPGIIWARMLEWVAISFSNACMHAKSLQSCPTLCDPMDSSPPGSSVHGIL